MKSTFTVVVLLIAFRLSRADVLTNGEQATRRSLKENLLTFPTEELVESIQRNNANKQEDFIEAWAFGIRKGNYEPIKSFTKHSQTNKKLFNENLPKIIQVAYANNLSNFEATLQFISEILGGLNLHRGYEALLNEMTENNHLYNSEIVKLAYKVKQAMGEIEDDLHLNRTIQKREANPLKHLMSRFPRSIEQLVSNKRCTLRNEDLNEYLYAANDYFNFNKDRGRIFTWRPGGEVGQGYWRLEPEDNGNYFLMKSHTWNQYMYAASDGFAYCYGFVGVLPTNCHRRRVFIWRPGSKVSQGRWVFEHLGGENYAIKNRERNEYLYASDIPYDNDRRYVFTWIPGDRHHHSSWRLNCS